MLKSIAELISSVAQIAWPVLAIVVIYLFRQQIQVLLGRGSEIALEVCGTKIIVKPATVALREPSVQGDVRPASDKLSPVTPGDLIPADYLFMNHTSFFRPEKQQEFRNRTRVKLLHYDIRVIVDSYYEKALDSVEYVEYILHETYPEPRQIRSNRDQKFLLKELANGEYVLLAKVYLKDRKTPLILQRYLTLWTSGPRLG